MTTNGTTEFLALIAIVVALVAICVDVLKIGRFWFQATKRAAWLFSMASK